MSPQSPAKPTSKPPVCGVPQKGLQPSPGCQGCPDRETAAGCWRRLWAECQHCRVEEWTHTPVDVMRVLCPGISVLAFGAAGCPSIQPEGRGAQLSWMCRMFYISHLHCHLAPSQPAYFLPNALHLHQAQQLQHMWSPIFCCHFQTSCGPGLISVLWLGQCLWLPFMRG